MEPPFLRLRAGTLREMFVGSHEHVLDDKGRTSLPKDFRSALASLKGKAFITALQNCLVILPSAAFEAWRTALTAPKARLDPAAQRLRRLILGMAAECNVDRQGRVNIPNHLLRHAGIEKEIVFMGVGEEIEVWDKSRHQSEIGEAGAHFPTDNREVLSRDS